VRALLARLTPTSFRGRIVASTVALMAGVMVVVGIGIQVLLAHTAQRDIDQVLAERADAVITVVDAAAPAGTTRPTLPASALEPGARVYDEHGRPVAGSVDPDARASADDLATVTTTTTLTTDSEIRLLAEPFTTGSGQQGVVVVSEAATPYERAELYALLVTVLIGVLVVCVTALIARRVTSQALAPVTQMAARAADWSEHDLTHRFDLGQVDDELGQLGETLDLLLDRVATAISSEQRLTAELAHELRTPLTAIQGSADLALMRGVTEDAPRADLEEISRAARSMGEVITALLDVARDPTVGSTTASCSVGEVVEHLRATVPHRLRWVEDVEDPTARVAGPGSLVMRAVTPVVENAVRHAGSAVTVRSTTLPHAVAITVSDDGPGVDRALREHLFEAGASGTGGTGLGLGIARRVARSLGGEVVVQGEAAGTAFVVRLPRA
jgi:signal transduction histidine kinase